MEDVRRPRALAGAVGIALAWAACAWASIVYTSEIKGIATFWPANAVLLAALLLRPPRQWVMPVLLVALAGIGVNLIVGRTGLIACGFPAVNAGEALFAAAMLRRADRDGSLFERTSGTAIFVAACGVAGATSATVAALMVRLHTGSFGDRWISWFAADTLGLLIITPLLLIARQIARQRRACGRAPAMALAYALVSLAPVTAVSAVVFFVPPAPSLFVVFPPMLFAVHRMRAFGAAASAVIVAVLGGWGTTLGVGSVAMVDMSMAGHLIFLQFYVAVLFLTALPTAALLAQRDAWVAKARAADERLREAAEAAADRAQALAATDDLTGIANRRAFMQRLEEEVARARGYRTPLALAIFDIDHFKRVNDAHGHGGGDAVLRGVAADARAAVRSGDLVARLGGEEFAVLMPGATLALAEPLAERLRARIEGLRSADDVGVTVSVGLAGFAPETTADALLAAADRALYAAKADGRNRLRLAA